MPLYFFNITYGQQSVKQNDGIELEDDKAAWVEATTACGEMMRDLDGDLKPGTEWRMEVKREAGDMVYQLRFLSEAYDPTKED